jgi:hypothetical protein
MDTNNICMWENMLTWEVYTDEQYNMDVSVCDGERQVTG